MADKDGLGKLQLMLYNAHVPKKYYNIFYAMFVAIKENDTSLSQIFANYNNGDGGQTIQNLKPPFICVDCGAHAGLTTDIIVHCGWIAHSFEPNIYLYEILKRKYLNTPNVYIYQKAVSNKKLYNKFFI